MFGMLDVRDVECLWCKMFGIWDVQDMRCSGCGIWDFGLKIPLIFPSPQSEITRILSFF